MMSQTIAIMGSGPLGLWTAAAIATEPAGYHIRIGNTRGKATAWMPQAVAAADQAGRITWQSFDALDAESVRTLASGTVALVHAANPQYHEWPEKLPVMQNNAIAAALAANASLICADSLYAYTAPRNGPLNENSPEDPPSRKGQIRKDMHGLLRAAQAKSGLRWATVQASDYFGPGASGQSHFGDRFVDPVLKGKTALFLGKPSVAHSWAFAPDFGRALAGLAITNKLELLNRSWILPHVSHAPAIEMAQAFFREMERQGLIKPKGRKTGIVPPLLLKLLGLFDPLLHEVDEMLYQFRADFTASGEAFSQAFGWEASRLDQAIAQTVAHWKETKQVQR